MNLPQNPFRDYIRRTSIAVSETARRWGKRTGTRTTLNTVAAALIVAGASPEVMATTTTYTWTGAGDGVSWSDTANWNPNGLPSSSSTGSANWDQLVFGGTGGSLNDDVGWAYQLQFSAGAGAYTLNGPLTMATRGITNQSSVMQTVSMGITLDGYNGAQTWDAGSGGLTVSSSLSLSNASLTIQGSGNTLISGNLYDTSAFGKPGDTITKTGTGTLTFSGTNDSFNLIINQGIVSIGSSANLGNSGTLTFGGGTLQATGAFTLSKAITINSGGGTFDNGGNNDTLSGVIGGSGAMTFAGTGITTLSGANTYTGGTTVSAGTLVGTTTSLQGNITNNATLEFNQSTNGTYAGIISGSGSLTKAGTGTLTLTGANTYSGGTTVSAGTLVGNTTSLQGNITDNGVLQFDQGSNGTFSSVISGTGNVAKTGTGTLTLTGTNTYSGGTTLTSGTLKALSDGTLGASSGGLTFNGGTFQWGSSFTSARSITLNSGGGTFDTNTYNATLSGIISGSAGLTKQSTGILTLTGANTYTGGTVVNGGTVKVSGSGTLGSNSGSVTVNNGSALDLGTLTQTQNGGVTLTSGTIQNGTLNSSGTFTLQSGTVSAALGGTGGVSKTTTGTVTFSGANSYTGTTTVSAGTLAAGAAGAFSANSATTINTGSTLDLGGFAQTVNSVALAGGTLTNGSLTGAITSSGGSISNITGAPTMATTAGTTTTLTGTNAFGNITNAGTIINNGVGSDDLSNTGTFTNNATWTANIASNTGTIDNVSTGTWNGDVLSGANVAGGQIINQGTWNGTTSYNNGGSLTNSGTWNGAITNAAGTFTNTGTMSGNLTNIAGATTVLGNSGVINGNVSNGGTLITNGAHGVMQVNGNYTQTSTGTLKIGVTPNASSGPGVGYDQLNVTGTAALSGALAVQVGSGTYSLGTKYDIVHAGSVTGQFGTVSYNPSFASYISPQLSYTGTDAYLTLNPTQTAFNSGQAVNISGWTTQLGLLGLQQGLLNVQGGTSGGILRVNQQPDPGVWARYLGGSGSSDGARLNNQAMLVGYGAEIRDGLVLGAAFTHTEDRTKSDSQRVKTKGTGLSVYGLFNQGAWFVDGAVSGGHLRTDSNRTLQPTGLVASGNANGNYAGFLAKAGYRITRDRLLLTPYALVGYQYTHRNSFSETGAGLLNATYAGQTSNLSIFSAGTRIGTDWRIRDNLTLAPWVDLGAITYGGDRNQQQTVTLGTVSQVLQASGAPSVAGVVNAGVSLMSNANWSAQLAYRGQFGSHTHMNTADLKVLYRW